MSYETCAKLQEGNFHILKENFVTVDPIFKYYGVIDEN
jgi:hypothetical protein